MQLAQVQHSVCMLFFQSIYRPGSGFKFPCNEAGQVNLDSLNDKQRANYLFARAMMGREFLTPQVIH